MSLVSFPLSEIRLPRSFDAAGGASAEANNEAVCVLSGIGGADILMAEWSNGVGRPCHYVAVDRASRQIVLSVRHAHRERNMCGAPCRCFACSLRAVTVQLQLGCPLCVTRDRAALEFTAYAPFSMGDMSAVAQGVAGGGRHFL